MKFLLYKATGTCLAVLLLVEEVSPLSIKTILKIERPTNMPTPSKAPRRACNPHVQLGTSLKTLRVGRQLPETSGFWNKIKNTKQEDTEFG